MNNWCNSEQQGTAYKIFEGCLESKSTAVSTIDTLYP